MSIKKKILYLDMDGVLADFDKCMKAIKPELYEEGEFDTYDKKSDEIDAIVAKQPHIFEDLEPMEGAIDAVKQLFNRYDVYFLSTPMWAVPESYMGKRKWVEKHFGEYAKKKLILSHRKDLAIGHYLVDDRFKNGAGEFTGKHIHFGNSEFPTWKETLAYLVQFEQCTPVVEDYGTVKVPGFDPKNWREEIIRFMEGKGYNTKRNDVCSVRMGLQTADYSEVFFKFVHVTVPTQSTEPYYRINFDKSKPWSLDED